MRRLNTAWGSLTTLRTVIVAGIAVAAVMACSLISDRAAIQAARQEVWIERNKVRVGMTINDVLPLVHGMAIYASADGAWLSVVPENKLFYYSPDSLEVLQHADGTFTVSCHCGSPQVSRDEKLTESQVVELIKEKPEQVSQNLTESQVAALMKQKMSDGFDWHWRYTIFKGSLESYFTVTFGRDGRVKDISDVYITDLRSHRA